MTYDSLTARLNKRVTILRPPGPNDWIATSGSGATLAVDGIQSYDPDGPANTLLNDLVDPNAPPSDEYGQPIIEPIIVANTWAGIEPLQGKEFFAAMRENAEVTTRIRIRYRTDIDRTMTVRYGSLEYEILYTIPPKLNKRELQLMCKERQ